jgi:phosphatidylglycerophosphate synthase
MTSTKWPPAQVIWLPVAVLFAVLVSSVGPSYGLGVGLRFTLFFVAFSAIASWLLLMLSRHIGPEPNTLANFLTLCRLAVGCALAAFVLSGARDRMASVAIIIWTLTLVSATLVDWLDGPLARREGPTRFGAVLDIESDSWLTLWSAGAAVALGGLPWIVLVPPLVRYIHPLLDLRTGRLPSGGGPWWSRATGVLQMAMLLAAFAPLDGTWRDALFAAIVWPVSLAQLATMLALRRR